MQHEQMPYHPVNNCLFTQKVYGWIINVGGLVGVVNSDTVGWVEYNEKCKCGTGDIVTMKLDLNQNHLSYSVNGRDLGIASNIIEDTEYKAMVSMNGKGDGMELISYNYIK